MAKIINISNYQMKDIGKNDVLDFKFLGVCKAAILLAIRLEENSPSLHGQGKISLCRISSTQKFRSLSTR